MQHHRCLELRGFVLRTRVLLAYICVGFGLWFGVLGCAGIALGQHFPVRPETAIKVGHDTKKEVLQKMGDPYRQAVDPAGRTILTYLWTDGKGKGEKCTIALNSSGVVSVVLVSP